MGDSKFFRGAKRFDVMDDNNPVKVASVDYTQDPDKPKRNRQPQPKVAKPARPNCPPRPVRDIHVGSWLKMADAEMVFLCEAIKDAEGDIYIAATWLGICADGIYRKLRRVGLTPSKIIEQARIESLKNSTSTVVSAVETNDRPTLSNEIVLPHGRRN